MSFFDGSTNNKPSIEFKDAIGVTIQSGDYIVVFTRSGYEPRVGRYLCPTKSGKSMRVLEYAYNDTVVVSTILYPEFTVRINPIDLKPQIKQKLDDHFEEELKKALKK